jgi:ubiquinone/menaquinone biosynthesis C-methylase UbiE
VTGIDLIDERIELAERNKLLGGHDDSISFKTGNTDRIDLPDGSVDVVLCFDVLEHVMDVESAIDEWLRVLRPGGVVLIWWSPWYGPFGHHIESLVPIPWGHVIFSERTLLKTAARIYELDSFQPRIWDVDERTGKKKENKWKSMQHLPDVNKLSIGEFEAKLSSRKERGLISLAQGSYRGFSGSTLSRMTNVLLKFSFLKEFFTSYVTYQIRKK